MPFRGRDANNLLAQIGIWQRGDISQCPNSAATRPRARRHQGAGAADAGADRSLLRHARQRGEIGGLVNAKSAELHPIPSVHGHRAGNPINNPADRAFINAEISALLQR
jgi:hypothetical protein